MYEWVPFFQKAGELLVPYATLVTFTIALSYLAKEGKHIFSQLLFLISSFSFLLVVIGLGFTLINTNPTSSFELSYEILCAFGLLSGITSLGVGVIYYIIPFEKFIKLKKKKR
jgi:hypothetical protein